MRKRTITQEDSAPRIVARCEVSDTAAYLRSDNIRVRNTRSRHIRIAMK